MADLTKYDTYKPSGIGWLGDIPSHWAQRKFKNVSYMKGRIGWQGLKNEEFSFNPNEPFLITGMNFKDGEIDWNEVYHISEERFDEAPEIQIFDGDVLMTKDGTIGKLLFIDKIPYPNKASLNSHLLVFRPTYRAFYPKYLYYQLQSEPFYHHIELTKTGTTFFGITQEAVGIYKLILPPLNEQKIITTYLDKEIQKIERLIANKKAQAAKLKELRQIEINNAVTKGINPDAELKESGYEWLGKIPEDWTVRKIKQLLKPEKNAIKTGPFGSDLKFEDLIEEGIKVYNQRSVLDNDWESGEGYISEKKYENLKTCTIYPEDMVITTRGTIGKVSIFPSNAELGILHPCLMRIQMNTQRILNDYLKIIINDSSFFFEALKLASNATTIDVIYSESLKEVKIPVPSISEQIEITEYLNNRVTSIDKLIKNIEKQIEKLQELRKIKIYEAVTGKIKVNAYAETTA